jgi:thiol-disulfide isomerase/thioredoxin
LIRALLLLTLAACAGTVPPPTAKPDRVLGQIEALTALDGAPIGAAADGHSTIVVVFASWCPHCRHELELLEAIREERPTLRIIGLNAYETFSELSDEQQLRGWLAAHAPWLRVAVGDHLLPAMGGVPKIPTLFLYDARGRLVTSTRVATIEELRLQVGKI